jgi:hypothetical protein
MRTLALVSLLSLLGCGSLVHGHSHHGDSHGHHNHMNCTTDSPNVAQRASMKAVEEWTKPLGSISARARPTYTVPVVVHILANRTVYIPVTPAQIQEMIAYLNYDFDRSNAPFVFSLRTTTKIIKSVWYNCSADNFDEFKEAQYQGDLGVLNIYMCNLYTNTFSLGTATLPGKGAGWRDGIGKSPLLTFTYSSGRLTFSISC